MCNKQAEQIVTIISFSANKFRIYTIKGYRTVALYHASLISRRYFIILSLA